MVRYEYYSPSETESEIRKAVARYCRKTFPIDKSADPESSVGFSAAVNNQLQGDEYGFFGVGDDVFHANLFKSPYAERIIPYSQCEETIDKIGLHPALVAAMGSFRPYTHQRDAFRAIGPNGNKRHLIVCTGTGSGKTESFLLPILDGIVREKEKEGAGYKRGVRALILYPMNALVEDQINRLREIIGHLPEELRPTFGQYTGITAKRVSNIPNNTQRKEALQSFLSMDESDGEVDRSRNGLLPIVGEYLSREEWEAGGADILITNYSMLERLLLRPEADKFFSSETWRYLAVDEAHSYTGSMGTEIAWLIRRLQKRVKASDMQFIATTATILSPTEDEKSNPERFKYRIASEFGAKLFPAKAEDFDVEIGEPIKFSAMCSDVAPCVKTATEIAETVFSYNGNQPVKLYARTVELSSEKKLLASCKKLLEAAGFGLGEDGEVVFPQFVSASVAARILSDIHPFVDGRIVDFREVGFVQGTASIGHMIKAVLSLFGESTAKDNDGPSRRYWSWYEFLHDPLRGDKSSGGNDIGILNRWKTIKDNALSEGGVAQVVKGYEFGYLYAAAEAAASELGRLSFSRNNINLDVNAMRDCSERLMKAEVSLTSEVIERLGSYYKEVCNSFKAIEAENDELVSAWRTLLGGNPEISDISRLLYDALSGRKDVKLCGEVLSGGMYSISPEGLHPEESLEERLVADQAFMDGLDIGARRAEIYNLFRLCMLANVPGLGSSSRPVPLLDVRYHQVIRGVSDVAVGFPTGVPADAKVCRTDLDTLDIKGNDFALFNLAVCRDCGQPYVSGYMQSSANGGGNCMLVRRKSPTFSEFHVFALEAGLRDVAELNHREQASPDEEIRGNNAMEVVWLNLKTGKVAFGCNPDDGSVKVTWHRKAKERSFIEICPNCGRKQAEHQHRSDPFGTITPYAASTAQVKVEMLEEFVRTSSPDTDPSVFFRPGSGRKVLAFSDSRNKAARFPGTFDSTFRRKLMVEEIRHLLDSDPESGPSQQAKDLIRSQINGTESLLQMTDADLAAIGESRASLLDKLAQKKAMLMPPKWTLKRISETIYHAIDRNRMSDVVKIFKNDGSAMNSYEGTAFCIVEALMERWGRAGIYPAGLVKVRSSAIYSGDTRKSLLNKLESFLGEESEIDNLLQDIFNLIFRNIRVVRSERDNAYDESWERVCSKEEGYDVKLVARAANRDEHEKEFRRLKLVRKLVIEYMRAHGQLGQVTENCPNRVDRDELAPILGAILNAFGDTGVLHRDENDAFVLDLTSVLGCGEEKMQDADKLLAYPNQGIYLEAGSTQYKYDDRYIKAGFVRIEEHTAQLEKRRARIYQRAFSDGRINVLSCSTTFEMGIDVGALPRVMMMNTPPGTANYKQRAGRAGRRPGCAPFILTFAEENMIGRKTFEDPRSLFNGPITPPRMYLEKRTFMSRHLRAEALHGFLVWWQHNEGGTPREENSWGSVKAFFYPNPAAPDAPFPYGAMLRWKDSESAAASDAYCRSLCEDYSGLPYWSAVNDLAIQFHGLDNLSAGLPFQSNPEGGEYDPSAYDYQQLSGPLVPEVDDVKGNLKTPENRMRQHVMGRVKEEYDRTGVASLERESIDVFGETNVVPRYAFPVDVTRLNISGNGGTWQKNLRDAPTRDMKTALYDYAPGSNVYLDKVTYRVGGFETDDAGTVQELFCRACGLVQVNGDPMSACPQCGNHDFAPPLLAVRPKWFWAKELKSGERESAQGERVQLFTRKVCNWVNLDESKVLVGDPDVKLMDFYNVAYGGEGFANRHFPANVAMYHELITDISVWVLPKIEAQLYYFGNSEANDPNANVPRSNRALLSAALILRKVLASDILDVGERDVGVVVRQNIDSSEGVGALPLEYGPAIVFYDLAQGGGGAVLPITVGAPGLGNRVKASLDAAIALCESVCSELGFDLQESELIPLSVGEWFNRKVTNETEGFRRQVISDRCFSNEDYRKADDLDIPDALAVLKLMRGDFGELKSLEAADTANALDLADEHWHEYDSAIELAPNQRIVVDGTTEGLYNPFANVNITHYWED